MELIEIQNRPGFRSWGCHLAGKPYVIVLDHLKGEYTASTKLAGDKTYYILDYGKGVKTIDEAKKAVLKYHNRTLQ